MNDGRVGELLWFDWDGNLYESDVSEPTVYYTFGHMDIHESGNEIVKRALASLIQRDGIAHSLGDAFRMIDNGIQSHYWAGYDPEGVDESLTVCDYNSETFYGDILDDVREVTFVELR